MCLVVLGIYIEAGVIVVASVDGAGEWCNIGSTVCAVVVGNVIGTAFAWTGRVLSV